MNHVNYVETMKEMGSAILASYRDMLKKAEFDKTFKAKVTGKVSEGKYQVLYRGASYTAAFPGSLAVGQMVYVRAPQNHWDELYITADSLIPELQKLIRK